MLGGLLSGWVSRVVRQGVAVYVCIIAWGVAIMAAGIGVLMSPGTVTAWAWLVIMMLVGGGAVDMFSASLCTAILQQSTQDHVQGRIQGIYIVIVVGGPRLADMFHDWSTGMICTGWTTFLGGTAVVLPTLVCVAVVPAFRR